ncbi:MAG TPA: SPOR domain-containing protein [Acidobacteriota bacterium]|nr:SPOR domain-containing protein [Acidobacteriota bacterium]
MENRAPESGLELVLDNRKLIVAFVLLIAVCGCFFVLGFVEGKRQGIQEGSRSTAAAVPAEQSEAKTSVAAPAKNQSEDKAAKEKLDWYKSVSSRDGTSKSVAAPDKEKGAAPKDAKETAAKPAPSTTAPSGQAAAAKTEYSVQVGVFKDRDKVEAAAKRLKSKGYQCYIESLDTGVHSLRVGHFESRAEAVALSHRLKADGFAALIKAK